MWLVCGQRHDHTWDNIPCENQAKANQLCSDMTLDVEYMRIHVCKVHMTCKVNPGSFTYFKTFHQKD